MWSPQSSGSLVFPSPVTPVLDLLGSGSGTMGYWINPNPSPAHGIPSDLEVCGPQILFLPSSLFNYNLPPQFRNQRVSGFTPPSSLSINQTSFLSQSVTTQILGAFCHFGNGKTNITMWLTNQLKWAPSFPINLAYWGGKLRVLLA